jgi:hypothetical protein
MKLFAIFGIICFIEPDVGKKCMNFWEEPVQHYKIEQCGEQAGKKGKEISDMFYETEIDILSLEVYCIPTKRQET